MWVVSTFSNVLAKLVKKSVNPNPNPALARISNPCPIQIRQTSLNPVRKSPNPNPCSSLADSSSGAGASAGFRGFLAGAGVNPDPGFLRQPDYFRIFTWNFHYINMCESHEHLKLDPETGFFAVRSRSRSGSGSRNFGAVSDPDLKIFGIRSSLSGIRCSPPESRPQTNPTSGGAGPHHI